MCAHSWNMVERDRKVCHSGPSADGTVMISLPVVHG